MNLKFRGRNFSQPLSDPRNPRNFSTLKILGYTGYLHFGGSEPLFHSSSILILLPSYFVLSDDQGVIDLHLETLMAKRSFHPEAA